jgi:Uma2 family endonuclease
MTELASLVTTPTLVPLTIEDYLRLDDAGAFADYGKTELIEGQVYYMNAQHRPHARIKSRLHVSLAMALKVKGSELEAIIEASIAVPPHNVPEPDIVLTDAADGDGLVPLESVKLVVEVSETTLHNDLHRKATIYATHGIPEYWVVDVSGRAIHRLWSATQGEYAKRDIAPFGAALSSVTIAGLTVPTDDL